MCESHVTNVCLLKIKPKNGDPGGQETHLDTRLRSRARCISPVQPSATGLGERTTMEGRSCHWGGYTAIGSCGRTQRRLAVGEEERWPECFQDLASWCRPPQDELNTPQALHDEFSFSIDGRGRGDCTWDDVSYPTVVDLWDAPDPPLPLLSPSLSANHQINNCSLEDDKVHNMDTVTRGLLFTNDEDDKTKIVPTVTSLDYGLTYNEDYHPIKSNGNVLLSQSSLKNVGTPDASQKTQSGVYLLLKSEEPFVLGSETRSSELNSSARTKQSKDASLKIKLEDEENDHFKVSQMTETLTVLEKRQRPKLKLNIGAAHTASTSTYTIDTPDVMKSLTEESTDFDLLSFVNGDFDDPNVLIADTSNLVTPGLDVSVGSRIVVTADPSAIKCDHDYTDSWVKNVSSLDFTKNSRKNEAIQLTPLEVSKSIKSEPLSPIKQDACEKRKPIKRRSTVESSEEYNFESETSSTDGDGSVDWSPYKRKKSKGIGGIAGGVRKRSTSGAQRANGGPKKLRKYSIDSDDGDSIKSGGTTNDRYRELRDRNNEASRKSRLNRKQKEIQMNQLAIQLEQQNVYLKNKADSLEKLVKKLRDTLMNIVLKK
ncbi:hypothetical protein AAG570_010082 [Ranatra chinensis]|uniref:BZIP domain-containing protein n=1 Tax=Ranatra chinensis TaxID=642074 RepID=A0ABD0YNP2_9HEMI